MNFFFQDALLLQFFPTFIIEDLMIDFLDILQGFRCSEAKKCRIKNIMVFLTWPSFAEPRNY